MENETLKMVEKKDNKLNGTSPKLEGPGYMDNPIALAKVYICSTAFEMLLYSEDWKCLE